MISEAACSELASRHLLLASPTTTSPSRRCWADLSELLERLVESDDTSADS